MTLGRVKHQVDAAIKGYFFLLLFLFCDRQCAFKKLQLTSFTDCVFLGI